MSDEQRTRAEVNAFLYEHCDRPGIDDELLYEMAFKKAFEFDGGLPPSSIFEAGAHFAAEAILGVALGDKLDAYEVSVLRDFYDALTGRGAFQLKLSNARRGRNRSSEEILAQAKADRAMLRLVEFMSKKTGKREAAVNAISNALKVSRATIFNQMKRAQLFERQVRERALIHSVVKSIELDE